MDGKDADDGQLNALHLEVQGMHCINCAVLVERRIKELPQVSRVTVSYPSGHAVVRHNGELDVPAVQGAMGNDGYTVSKWDDAKPIPEPTNRGRDYVEIGATFLLLAAAALVLQQFHLLPRGLTISDSMSYGLVFLIGLVASVSSCLAVTGGLLVALAAKYNSANASLSDGQRMLPHMYFNAGRLVSYPLLGAVVGALGSALTLSPAVGGVVTILASSVMIVLGLQMLGLFPSFALTLPKSIAHRIHDVGSRATEETAFLLGGLTFFLPCGFTQALQLYVLAKGDAVTGALTMLAFALGTLPALLSLSALSSFAKGGFQKHFLRFAGAAVILLGLLNVQYGLVLTGKDMRPDVRETKSATGSRIEEANAGEVQRISMKVVGLDYLPNTFTVKQGVPVEWWIDGSQADGCGRVLIAPRLRIQKILSASSTTLISFTPGQPGDYAFNCGMGMMTPDSKITVVPNKG
jgi:sulfite exporter TauE/SafE/copper chaperone CopZ